jgi:hypothetical protein
LSAQSENQITTVRYFTARVSARVDAEAPTRQQIYFDALKSLSEIEIHLGNFLVRYGRDRSLQTLIPPSQMQSHHPGRDQRSFVFKTEEKGSVNIACHLLMDCFQNAFDVAVVLSNDTDLVEPIRMATKELKTTGGILTPVPKPATSLVQGGKTCAQAASRCRTISRSGDPGKQGDRVAPPRFGMHHPKTGLEEALR